MGPAPDVQVDLGLDVPADGFEKQNRVEVLLTKENNTGVDLGLISLPTWYWLFGKRGQGEQARGSWMCLGTLVTGLKGLLTLPHWDVRAGARPYGTLHKCESTPWLK